MTVIEGYENTTRKFNLTNTINIYNSYVLKKKIN